MQCPPTKPGLKGKKVPFSPGIRKTDCVNIH